MRNFEDYIIRHYKKGDEEGITALFRVVFGKVMTINQWRWKYLHTGKRVFSKMVENPAGEIIAHVGAIPLRGIFQNKPVQFFQIADVMVHPKARGYLGMKNIFSCLMKSLLEDIAIEFFDVFCYGFPGERPYKLGKRIGVYDRIEKAVECFKQLSKTALSLYSVKRLKWDDDRLDNFWERLSKDFSLSIIRDKDYLQWRYATNQFFLYQLLGIFLFGKLKGWVVIKEEREKVSIIDFLIEKRNLRHALKALENYFVSNKRKASLHLWLPTSWRNIISDYRQKETDIIVTNMVWKLPIQTSLVKEKLFYTMGDADIF